MPEDARKRNDRQYAWQKENTDRINFTMPKGRKEQIKEAAEIAGVSATVWINQAIDAKFEDAGYSCVISAPIVRFVFSYHSWSRFGSAYHGMKIL